AWNHALARAVLGVSVRVAPGFGGLPLVPLRYSCAIATDRGRVTDRPRPRQIVSGLVAACPVLHSRSSCLTRGKRISARVSPTARAWHDACCWGEVAHTGGIILDRRTRCGGRPEVYSRPGAAA